MKKNYYLTIFMILCLGSFLHAQSTIIQQTKPEKKERAKVTTIDQSPDIKPGSFKPVSAVIPAQKKSLADKSVAWDILYSFNASSSAQAGIETDGNNIYTALWNGSSFFRYSMDGTLDESFTISGVSGIRDMAYDGIYFYGSNASMTIYIMDLANETLISTISVTCSGISGIRHIAYDPTLDGGNGGFWIGNWDELGAITMLGTQIYGNLLSLDADFYGSAYDPFTNPTNPRLLLFAQVLGSGVDIAAFDINTLTYIGIVHSATDISGFVSGSIAGGLCLYGNYSNGNVELIGNLQQDPNLIFSYFLTNLCDTAAPAMPQNLSVTPDAAGALQALVTWDNPVLTVDGDELTDFDSVLVIADETIVYTNTSPVIGGSESHTISVATPGSYIINVMGYNDYGNGIPSTYTTWIGEDIPAAPTALNLSISESTATLTWVAPTGGMHGGYFSGTNVTYDILLNGVDIVAENISNTSFSMELTERGGLSFTVNASNLIGSGGSATSNSLTFGYLFYEDFSEVLIPEGWAVQGVGSSDWSVNSSSNAGGEANELVFNYNSWIDTSTMVTTSFTTDGEEAIELVFDHYINHYGLGYALSIVTSSDGVNWNEVWSITPDGSYGPNTEVVTINNNDVGSETFYLGFRLTGNSYQINYWYIDNIMVIGDLEPVDVAFHVSDTSSNPLKDVNVSFGYNGEETTDINGYLTKTMYKDSVYIPTCNWEASKFGYFPTGGSFMVDEPDTVEIELVPMDIYNLTFIVSDTSGALLPDIGVNLEYYESMVTDENGVALYDTVYDSQGEAIDWSVWTLGYSHASGSIVIEDNDTLYVELTPLTGYPVTFEVYDSTGGDTIAVEGVTISLELYGDLLTDVEGIAVYDSVFDTEGEVIEWSASLFGYYIETGSVVITDTTDIILYLEPLPAYSVTFAVSDTNGDPVSGATVNLDVYGEATTNASGLAVFESVYETLTPGIPYQISATNYFDNSGNLILISDSVVEIELVHYPYFEITFHITDGTNNVGGVNVALTGYGNETTSAGGLATFENVMYSAGENIAYEVTGTTINSATGNVVIDMTKTVNVVVSYLVGIPEIAEEIVNVYPNPATDVITISCSEEINSMEILSTQGKLIKSLMGNGKEEQIQLTGLKSGNFLLIIRTDSNTYVEPLIIVE